MSEFGRFEQIIEILQEINDKQDKLLFYAKSDKNSELDITDTLDVMTLLSLPDHLRTTVKSLYEFGYATAEDVSKLTHKKRAVESGYLNELVRLGYIRKCRKGKKVYFTINENTGDHR